MKKLKLLSEENGVKVWEWDYDYRVIEESSGESMIYKRVTNRDDLTFTFISINKHFGKIMFAEEWLFENCH